jgi:hypothetical protein
MLDWSMLASVFKQLFIPDWIISWFSVALSIFTCNISTEEASIAIRVNNDAVIVDLLINGLIRLELLDEDGP